MGRAFAWFRSQPLPSFGDRTAEELVKEGRVQALKDYLARIADGRLSVGTSPGMNLLPLGGRWAGILYRAHHPRWSYAPTSGAGAARHGGRFNRRGVPALYTALDPKTAWMEAQQGMPFKAQPLTLVAYRLDCEPIVDLTDGAVLASAAIDPADLACPWEDLVALGLEPPSWRLVSNLPVGAWPMPCWKRDCMALSYPASRLGPLSLQMWPGRATRMPAWARLPIGAGTAATWCCGTGPINRPAKSRSSTILGAYPSMTPLGVESANWNRRACGKMAAPKGGKRARPCSCSVFSPGASVPLSHETLACLTVMMDSPHPR